MRRDGAGGGKCRSDQPPNACWFSTGGCNAAPSMESIGRKGAEKFDRASPVGWHKQIGLNCTGGSPSTAGRTTTEPTARQRSVRRKPLTLSQTVSTWRDGAGDQAMRSGEALVLLTADRDTIAVGTGAALKARLQDRQGYSTPPTGS